MMPTRDEIYWHQYRMRAAEHCAEFASGLLEVLATLPDGRPMTTACIAGIEGTKEALQRIGMSLEYASGGPIQAHARLQLAS